MHLPISLSSWSNIRSFIARNRDVFNADSRTSFKIGLYDVKHDIEDVFDIDFRKYSGCDEVFIFGESRARHNMKTSIQLDPYQEIGKISIPEFGGSIKLEGDKCFLEQDKESSPLFFSIAKIYLKFYCKVLDHIISGEDKPIEDELNSIRLRKYSYS